MNTRLGDRSLRAVLDLAVELQAVEQLADLPGALLPGLLRLVDADLAGWNDVDPATGALDGRVYPDQSSIAAFAELNQLPEAPLPAYLRCHVNVPAARISDVCDEQAWHATPAYIEVFRPHRMEHQLAMARTAASGRIIAVALNRSRLDFSERDCQAVTTCAPHIVAAHRRLLHAAAREAALGPDTGWILLDAAGVTLDIGRAARDLLHRCGVRLEPGQPVPPLPPGLTLRRLDREPAGDGTVLLAVRPSPDPAALGLTARQYQVLRAVAEGATAATAARHLDIATRTVTTHLRDAYAALGVTSRVAALDTLRKHGLLDP